MSNILIIHGVGGNPQENWFPWLKTELEKLGHTVLIPQFPTPEGQNLNNWLQILEQYENFLTPETIIIGHSLGVPFVLTVLEKHEAKAAFLVAGFTGKNGNKFDDSMKTFAQKPFNWEQIKKNCPHFTIFHSDNDPYIKLEKAHELAANLNTTVTLIPNAGHFNTTSGYTTFAELFKNITNLAAT